MKKLKIVKKQKKDKNKGYNLHFYQPYFYIYQYGPCSMVVGITPKN